MPNGKICYVEIPANDVEVSARFYETVFGWKTRSREGGQRAFDDATGAVSGTWVLGRKPSPEPGLLTYVMVDSIDGTLRSIGSAGGRVATPKTPIGDSGAWWATFHDPAGNLLGLYQDRSP